MTITISGHTLPVVSLDHARAIQRKADRIRREDGPGSDRLYQWLYAGAPVRGWKDGKKGGR